MSIRLSNINYYIGLTDSPLTFSHHSKAHFKAGSQNLLQIKVLLNWDLGGKRGNLLNMRVTKKIKKNTVINKFKIQVINGLL